LITFVRPIIKEDIDKLVEGFLQTGMLKSTCMFYATDHQNVTKKTTMVEEYNDNWDPIWKTMSDEFHSTLLKTTNLKHLRGKMFFLCEGNHRCQA
jgi:hypothetical protein